MLFPRRKAEQDVKLWLGERQIGGWFSLHTDGALLFGSYSLCRYIGWRLILNIAHFKGVVKVKIDIKWLEIG